MLLYIYLKNSIHFLDFLNSITISYQINLFHHLITYIFKIDEYYSKIQKLAKSNYRRTNYHFSILDSYETNLLHLTCLFILLHCINTFNLQDRFKLGYPFIIFNFSMFPLFVRGCRNKR